MEEITEEHTVQEGKETDGTEGHRIEGRIEKIQKDTSGLIGILYKQLKKIKRKNKQRREKQDKL